jgi:hypothetical protein
VRENLGVGGGACKNRRKPVSTEDKLSKLLIMLEMIKAGKLS